MKAYLCFLFTLVFFSTGITAQATLFPNSVTSNDIDFVLETDADAFSSLAFVGRADKEMPSSLTEELFDQNTFVFRATFTDGETLEIWCHSSFETQAQAQEYADKLCPRLGKLPDLQRNMLDHVVVHNGNAGAFAEIEGQFFILYSENMDARISTNDLEETVFHESVHGSYQFMYQDSDVWTNAQADDPAFVTDYAQENEDLEDMAEAALFAYTYLKHPGRLSPEIETWLEEKIPNRLAFFRTIYMISTSTEEGAAEPRILAYPNPTDGVFKLSLRRINAGDRLEVFDASGKQVRSVEAVNGVNEVDLGDCAHGLYFITAPGYRKTRIVKR
jgi:hypothetical protein